MILLQMYLVDIVNLISQQHTQAFNIVKMHFCEIPQ